jgi:3,4-dihydroxy-2-butanone 4-phosphate synthase
MTVLHRWPPTPVTDKPKRVSFSFDKLEDALEAFARGEFVVVMDDESRENEGDLIIAACHCTTEKMAWMIKHTRHIFVNSLHFRLY